MLEFDIHCQRGNFELNARATIPAGSITAIFGKSGAGKTTLLNCIAGFEKKLTGSSVTLNGSDWLTRCGKSKPIHHRRVGYVTQQPALFDHLSVADNLQYAIARQRPHESIDKAPLYELFSINSLLNKTPDKLSGGQRQRVAIVRTLLASPHVLLFDEPLNALDEQAREQLLGHLESLHRVLQIPTLYVTHNLEELLRLSDTVIALEDGHIIRHHDTAHLMSSTDTPWSDHYNCGVIIEAPVVAFDAEYGLCKLALSDQLSLWFSGDSMAGIRTARIRVFARDISISLRPQENTSILNILPATITDIETNHKVQLLVKLRCGNYDLLARLTRKSISELALTVGQQVTVQIKGAALLSAARTRAE